MLCKRFQISPGLRSQWGCNTPILNCGTSETRYSTRQLQYVQRSQFGLTHQWTDGTDRFEFWWGLPLCPSSKYRKMWMRFPLLISYHFTAFPGTFCTIFDTDNWTISWQFSTNIDVLFKPRLFIAVPSHRQVHFCLGDHFALPPPSKHYFWYTIIPSHRSPYSFTYFKHNLATPLRQLPSIVVLSVLSVCVFATYLSTIKIHSIR